MGFQIVATERGGTEWFLSGLFQKDKRHHFIKNTGNYVDYVKL